MLSREGKLEKVAELDIVNNVIAMREENVSMLWHNYNVSTAKGQRLAEGSPEAIQAAADATKYLADYHVSVAKLAECVAEAEDLLNLISYK